MRDREKAEELLAQAWEHASTQPLERVEMLLSALVHAVLAAAPDTAQVRNGSAQGWNAGPDILEHA